MRNVMARLSIASARCTLDLTVGILAHIPARFAQLDGDASIAIPAVLGGQRDDSPGQRVFVVPLCGLVALRAAWLMNQLARMTLTRPTLLCMLQSDTAPNGVPGKRCLLAGVSDGLRSFPGQCPEGSAYPGSAQLQAA